ncbi:tetratricopeptide repeat-containing family protein [Striga asiatica]|uniref:E3 ubiquitin-protein ligase CHIP n=1 Tax=Striga asiatica TaxID=4170 RepID=A0A5A7RA02_STRAF|nr:tetratricopeptide repeat-containing family protein [Striga asiatica]
MSPIAAAKQAEQLRQDGNAYFKKDRFGAAIDAYTEAITLCPNVPIYWTNRALCHRKRNEWARVEEDCRRAIQLDHHSLKVWSIECHYNKDPDILFLMLLEGDHILCVSSGHMPLLIYILLILYLGRGKFVAHYMLGLALLQKKEYAEGVKELEKALDLGRGANPKGYMVEEMWQELARAKYLEWEHESIQRSWELQSLKQACEAALKEKHFLDGSQTEGFVDEHEKLYQNQLEALDRVFNKAAENDTPTEVPDYLCCKITLDIFRDPVITPSGLSYERAVILEHLQKVGKFDPITRETLYPSQLVPNLALKEAVRGYLDEHGWAYRMD